MRALRVPLFAETLPPILQSSIIILSTVLLEQETDGFQIDELRRVRPEVS